MSNELYNVWREKKAIYLCSESQSKLSCLKNAGYTVNTISVDVEEGYNTDQCNYEEIVTNIAFRKLLYGMQAIRKSNENNYISPFIVCSDILVRGNGHLLKKPKSDLEIKENFINYNENNGFTCYVGVGIGDLLKQKKYVFSVVVPVKFISKIDIDEIDQYIKRANPYSACGGIIIDDKIFENKINITETEAYAIRGMPCTQLESMLNIICNDKVNSNQE